MSNLTNKVTFRLSDEELEGVRKKMAKTNYRWLSDYMRALIDSSLVVVVDLESTQGIANQLDEHFHELKKIGTNVNQLARFANTYGVVYADNIEKMRKALEGMRNVMLDFREKVLDRQLDLNDKPQGTKRVW